MRHIKQLLVITSLVIAGVGCTSDGTDPEPTSDEGEGTGTVEQAVCGTGTYNNQCREYTGGTLWNQTGCPNLWRQNYYDNCEEYYVSGQWRHEGCETKQSYFCSNIQYPFLPAKCQKQC